MLKQFATSAKDLSKNPLGIIALFIVLIYGFAALTVAASSNLEAADRHLICQFLVTFPFVVLGVFGWLVSCHYEKLYAPRDFKSDDGFINTLKEKNARPELKNLDKKIDEKIKKVLSSESLTLENSDSNTIREKLSQAAEEITNEIRNSSFITVDARAFTKSDEDVFELPVSAFRSFGEFTDEIYFAIDSYVKPFEYGHSWVIRNPRNNEIIKNSRMITGVGPGDPVADNRSLAEVGIFPGSVLEIIRP